MAIHPTAIINPQAEIHSSVEIGPYCVIDGHVRIGANCKLYHQVYVTGWTEIGAGCVLHPGVIVGHEPQDTKYKGERSYCRIGQGTVLREYVTIHRASGEDLETVIGEWCFLLGGSHVGHNCIVGNDVTLVNNVLLAGHVTVQDRVTMGGSAMVHQFARVGELAMVSGFAPVHMDIVPFAMTDLRGKITGVNRVGLKRSNLSEDEISEIRESFRTLFRAGMGFSEASGVVVEKVKTPAGKRLADFLGAESKRGIAGSSRD